MKIKIRFGSLCAMLLLVTACPQVDSLNDAADGDPSVKQELGGGGGPPPFATFLSVDRTEVVFQDSVNGVVRCTATSSASAEFCWPESIDDEGGRTLLELSEEDQGKEPCDVGVTTSERTYRLVAPPEPGGTTVTLTVRVTELIESEDVPTEDDLNLDEDGPILDEDGPILDEDDPILEPLVIEETVTLNLLLPPAPLSLTIRAPSEVVQGVTTDGGVDAVDYAVTATVIGGTPFGVDDGLGGCPGGFAGDLKEESRYCVEWFFQGPRPEDEPISLETKAIEVLRDDGGSGEVVFATQFTAPEGVVDVYQVTARVRDKAGNVVGEARPVRIVPANPLRVETSQDQDEVEPSASATIDIQITGGTLPYTVIVGLISETGASVEVTATPENAVVLDPDDGPITITMDDEGPSENDPLTLTYTAGIQQAHDSSDTVTIDVSDKFEQLPQISRTFDVVSALGFSVDVADPVLSCCIGASTSITVEIDADKGDEPFVYNVEVLSGETRISDAVDGALDAILTETTDAREFTFFYFAPNEATNEVIRITTSDASGAESSRDVTVFVGPPTPLTVAVVAVPPVISLGGQTQLTATPGGLIGAPSFEWSVVDGDGVPRGTLAENGREARWTAPQTTGGYTVIVKLRDGGRTTDEVAVATTIVVVSDQLDLTLEGIRVLPAGIVRQGTRVDVSPLGLAGGIRPYVFEWGLCDPVCVDLGGQEAPHFITEVDFDDDPSDIVVSLKVRDNASGLVEQNATIGVYDINPVPDRECLLGGGVVGLHAGLVKTPRVITSDFLWQVIPDSAGGFDDAAIQDPTFTAAEVGDEPIQVTIRCTVTPGGDSEPATEEFGLVIAPALALARDLLTPTFELEDDSDEHTIRFQIPFDFETGGGDLKFEIRLDECYTRGSSPIEAFWGIEGVRDRKIPLTRDEAGGGIEFLRGSFCQLKSQCEFRSGENMEKIGSVVVTDEDCGGEELFDIRLTIVLGDGGCSPP